MIRTLVVGVTVSAGLLFGQEVAPTPPLVASVPANGHWLITSTANEEGRFVSKLDAVKVGAIKLDRLYYSDNSVEERWYVEDRYSFVSDTFSRGSVLVLEIPERNEAPDGSVVLTSTGFVGVDWIEERDFVDVVQVSGKRCYHFARTEEQKEAWIDIGDRLPVAFRDGERLYSYTFLMAPASLSLPAAQAKALEEFTVLQARRRALERDLAGR